MLNRLRRWILGDAFERLAKLEASVLELRGRVAPLPEAVFIEFQHSLNQELHELRESLEQNGRRKLPSSLGFSAARHRAEAGAREAELRDRRSA